MNNAAESVTPKVENGITRTIATFKQPYFGVYWGTNILQFMGFQMQQVAKQWLITDLTASRTLLGLVGFIQGVTGFATSPVAGVVSDRLSKRNMLIAMRAVLLTAMLFLAVLVWTGRIEVWHIFAASVLFGVAQAVQQPASQTYVYDIVGKGRVQNAVALNSTGQGISGMLGPAVGGVIIAWVGVTGAYMTAALGTLAGIAVLTTIPILGSPAKRKTSSMFADLKEGMSYVAKDKALLLVILASAMSVFNSALFPMRPIFARYVLGQDSIGYGTMAAFNGIGTIVGATLVTMVLPTIKRPGIAITASMLAFATGLFLYSFAFSFAYILAIEFFIGLAGQMWQISTFSGLQSVVPEEMRGRIVSMVFMFAQLGFMGQLAAGLLADAIGDKMALRLFGLIPMCILSLELLLGYRILMRLVPRN